MTTQAGGVPGIDVAEAAKRLASAISDDRPETRAVLGQADRTAVATLVDALLARDPDLVLSRFDALTAAGHDLTVLALQMLEDLRDLTVARTCRNRELFVDATADELEELTKRLLEGELTEHLGYEKHATEGRNGGNSRNGRTTKRVKTDTGEVEIEVPRDREGSFEPKLVAKGQRRLPGFDEGAVA